MPLGMRKALLRQHSAHWTYSFPDVGLKVMPLLLGQERVMDSVGWARDSKYNCYFYQTVTVVLQHHRETRQQDYTACLANTLYFKKRTGRASNPLELLHKYFVV